MRWKWIVVLMAVGFSMLESSETVRTFTAVVVGTERRQLAEKVAADVKKLLAENPSTVRVNLQRVRDVWLVKVGPLKTIDGRPDPQLAMLAEYYPDLLLLFRGSLQREGATTEAVSETLRKRDEIGPLSLFGLAIRWEWLALVMMALIGGIWLYLRSRRLKRLEDEQKRLEYRQNSIRARLKVER